MCIIAQIFGCDAITKDNRLAEELNTTRLKLGTAEHEKASLRADNATLNEGVNLWQQRFSEQLTRAERAEKLLDERG